MKKILNHWDQFARQYSEFSNCTAVMQLQVWNMMKIHQSNRIIECGCGNGHMLPYLLFQKKKSCDLVACDLSQQMVKLAAQRVEEMIKQGSTGNYGGIDQSDLQQIEVKQTYEFPVAKLKIEVANAEDLQYESEYFDSYYSNFVLNLTQNPNKMLQEAFRVLQPKGMIGISIPKKDQESTFCMTFINDVLKKLGVVFQGIDCSLYYDEEEITKMFKDHGFENLICWNSQIPFPQYDVNEQELRRFMNHPILFETWNAMNIGQKQIFINELKQELDKIKQKEPQILKTLAIIGTKKNRN